MGWSAIRTAIKTQLDALATAGTLGAVMNGEQFQQATDITGWPAAEIIRVSSEPDYFTNREDMQSYVFAINLYQQIHETDNATVECSMDSVVDAVIQKFLDNVNLGGVSDGRIEPIQAAPSVIAWQGKSVRRDQIMLKCRKITAMA